MKQIYSSEVEACRVTDGPMSTEAGDRHGVFYFPMPPSRYVVVQVTPGDMPMDYPGAEAYLASLEAEGFDTEDYGTKGTGWDHVSVQVRRRKKLKNGGRQETDEVPEWDLMRQIRDFFFDPEETVMQLHPGINDFVVMKPTTLHLWRPMNAPIPVPPAHLVC